MRRLKSKHYSCDGWNGEAGKPCDFEMYVLSRHDTAGLKCPVDGSSLFIPVKRQDKKWWQR